MLSPGKIELLDKIIENHHPYVVAGVGMSIIAETYKLA